MDCSPTISSIHRILQARILEWAAMPSSGGIFLTQGSNLLLLYPLHWQVGSLPLSWLGRPDVLVQRYCLLRNLYVGQEAVVRPLYGAADWFKIEKGVRQDCLLSSCLFNLYAEHIIRNAGLDELQAWIKIGRRNIKNLRYADDITLMGKRQRGTKEPLEGEGAGLKLNIKKN